MYPTDTNSQSQLNQSPGLVSASSSSAVNANPSTPSTKAQQLPASTSNPSSPSESSPNDASTDTANPLKLSNLESDPADSANGSNAKAQATSPNSNKSPRNSASPSPPASPERPSTSALHLNQYITRDTLHAAALVSQTQAQNELIRQKRREAEYYHELRRERMQNPAAVFGPGYQGFGNGFTDGKTAVVYPYQRKRTGNRKARAIRFMRKGLREQAEQLEILVPIRLEIDWEKHKLRDTFTWNLHDKTVPLEFFAEQLVEDFHLPITPSLVQSVKNSIADQVTEFHPHVFYEDQPLIPSQPYWAYKNDEMRILIKLNITIGQHTLIDQFEWDINNPMNSPEEFANKMCKELSLSGEFTTAIAHCIREQSQLYTRSLYMTGYPFDGRPVEDEDLRAALLPSPLPNVIRSPYHAKEYGPLLYELSEQELERAEKSLSREARRKRRVNRRGGPALPDLKDVPKTNRSQIVSSVIPGAVQKVSDLKMNRRTARDQESEDSDSDSDTAAPTPQPTAQQLSNMTRRQRAAALNAANALAARASTARSATPEVHQLHNLRSVTPLPVSFTRRLGDPDSVLVKLKIGRDRLQRLLEQIKAKERAAAQRQSEAPETTPGPRKEESPPPPPSNISVTPRPPTTTSSAPATRQKTGTPAASGNADADSSHDHRQATGPGTPGGTPSASTPSRNTTAGGPSSSTNSKAERTPPAPKWLQDAIQKLKETNPDDRVEATMRNSPVNADTGKLITPGASTEGINVIHQVFPRIRCLDCPGKLYMSGPGETLDNFMTHLKNKTHRERVEARVKGIVLEEKKDEKENKDVREKRGGKS
ncbi:SNF5-domain-containing protein [Ascobolus immersus RN42]|uniref:SNF5-domain-containing protein n=1 Tax=Ascobolus immersus RN42 TaxID=1160509 RepID=A0A3N4IU40_ASCIM|nr:SNF5-domain-containing protein [Ascobolus immersus RN42]